MPRLEVAVLMLACTASHAFNHHSHLYNTHSTALLRRVHIEHLASSNKLAGPMSLKMSIPVSSFTTVAGRASALLAHVAPRVASNFMGTVAGGALSGSLHAVTGPDHLAALLPRCVGVRWYRAVKVGAVWGLGHGLTATMLGVFAYLLKGQVPQLRGFKTFSFITEAGVGISLILIGALGLKDAITYEVEPLDRNSSSELIQGEKRTSTISAVFANGLLHGFSWDGAPSLAPALALSTWGSVASFLMSYCLGTMVAMSLAMGLIGEGTNQISSTLDRPDIPRRLSFATSLVAMAVGAIWTLKAVL